MDISPAPTPQDPNLPRLPAGEKPENNLVLAIIATLCCCVPTGIAAIVYAAQVDGKWAGGDIAGAQRAADESKKWSYISIAVGIVVTIAWVALGGLSHEV